MSSNLYEILGLEKTATTEEIRKAYKKKALATHPDRLPQGVSDEEKEKANEQFRLVNNAYEVLTNTENRKSYDQYGVWPPPTSSPVDATPAAGPSYTHEPFSGFAHDPFFGRSRSMRGYAFTDPFELFNSLFGDLHRAFASDPFFDDFPSARSPFDSMFGPSPLHSRQGGMFGRSPFASIGFSPFGDMMATGMGGGNLRSYSSVSQSIGSGGQWVSQSSMTRTINGRTETIVTRRDAQGNEHVTHSTPEGERYTINGIEQGPQDRSLPSPQQPPSATAPRPPPTINYNVKPSAHNYAPPQQIPVNYANHQTPATSYQVPVRDSATQYAQAPSVSRHSSHSHHHHASCSRGDEGDGVRRSSSSRHRSEYERERAEAAYGDRYERDAPRRSSSGRHAHHDKYSEPRQDPAARYAEPPRQDPGAKYNASGYPGSYSIGATAYPNAYTNGYAPEPPRSSHSHHSSHSRHRDSRDERRYDDEPRRGDGLRYDDGHHKHKWTHGWLSALGRLFRWPHHHHRHEKIETAAKA